MIIRLLNRNTAKLCLLAIAIALPLQSFSLDKKENVKAKGKSRVEVDFKQRHSRTVKKEDLYADGIKIKRDLSLIEEAQEARILDMDEIPADDIYGGIWSNNRVNPYAGMEARPDTFNVNLTNFSMPTMGYTTSDFGQRKRRMHYGVDLKVQTGDTIYAAFDGKVRLCQYEGKGYGYYVVLRHPNGLESIYGHLSGFLVKEDQIVKSGEPIALGGNTGRSTGSHLHLEFRFLGKPINPTKIVDFANKVCHRDAYTITPKTFDYKGSPAASKYSTAYNKSSGTNKYLSGKVSYHRVKKGDNLLQIARKNGTTVKKLCKLNNISSTSKLRLGQSLRTT